MTQQLSMVPTVATPRAQSGAPLDHDDNSHRGVMFREQALERLYRDNYVSLLSYALKLTLGDRPLAEDLVQETMMRAWRHIDTISMSFDAGRPWLFTVARRIAIDGSRARGARPVEVHGEVVQYQAAAEDQVDRALTALDIKAAMSSLSTEHRAVLVLLYLQGYSVEETATTLGIPAGTVKSRSYYALRALRKAALGDDRTATIESAPPTRPR